MSYLLTGQPASSDGASSAILMTFLKSLNSKNQSIGGLQSQIQQELGLSFDYQSQDTVDALGNTIQHNSSVMISKTLSRRLALRYSIGIVNPVNTISLIYKINNKWSVQTSSSTEGNGMDLFYTIERN